MERARPDVILVGGDIAWGPMPQATVAALRALGDKAVFVRGNADREVAGREIEGADASVADVTAWCWERLSEDERAFLAGLPPVQVLTVEGLGPTVFCHGSPRSDEEAITASTPATDLEEMLSEVREPVVVCGHTHAQFDRALGKRRVVNPGSLGLQRGERGAHWALLGPEVDLRITPYDVEQAASDIRASGCPHAEEFAAHVLAPPLS